MFLERTLIAGLRWVMFEPKAPTLWGAIRQSVEVLLHDLWQHGALAGETEADAFRVICEGGTTPTFQKGNMVTITVAFAPLKAAEFIVIRIDQPNADTV